MDKRYARSWWAVVLFLVVFLSTSTIRRCGKNTYRYDEGLIFGTFYHITYKYPESLSEEIKNRLLQFDASLSPFNDTSIISRINRNEPVETDRWFEHVFNASQRIYTRTGGTFDPTVSPLVNAWGFGFKKVIPDSVQVDSLLRQVGMNKLTLENHRILKSDTCVTLNFSAIAKGYACDVIGQLLSDKGIDDFMVEIGGEVFAPWEKSGRKNVASGVNRPTDADSEAGTIEEIVQDNRCPDWLHRVIIAIIVWWTEKRITYDRPRNRLSGTTHVVECDGNGSRLYDCRCICYPLWLWDWNAVRHWSILCGVEALFLYQNGSDTTRIDYWATPGMREKMER